MKNFRKAHAALSIALLLSSLSSFAMSELAEYFGLSSSSESVSSEDEAVRAAKRAERAARKKENSNAQSSLNLSDTEVAKEFKLSESAQAAENRSKARIAKERSAFSYRFKSAFSNAKQSAVKGASSLKSGAKYVVTPFGKRSSTDRADYTKAIFSRFGTGRTGKLAVSLFQNAHQHNYIANGVYYPSLALVAYAGYKYAPAAWNKAKAGYVSLKDAVNGFFAKKATLSGIITAANSKIEAVNNGEVPGLLSGIVAKDYNMSLAINNLPEAKQKELSSAISAFDLAFTRRGNERAKAVDQALTGLETIVDELVAA